MTIAEAAEQTGAEFSPDSLRRYLHKAKFPLTKLGKRRLLVNRNEFTAFMKARTSNPETKRSHRNEDF